MKKSIITLALLLGLSAVGFAATKPVVNSNQPAEINNTELNEDEQALLNKLTNELEISEEEVLANLEIEEHVEAYYIYDAQGNLIASQEGNVDTDEIPEEASLLMTDDAVQYYMIF